MNTALFDGNEVRNVVQDGQPWFSAIDVCNILGIKNHDQAIERLSDDEYRGCAIPTIKGDRLSICVNESGLYTLILRSSKPSAQEFRKWITSKVLPSIRKYGVYIDSDFTMNTREIALVTGVLHNKALLKIADFLPMHKKDILRGLYNKTGFELDAMQSYFAAIRLVKSSLEYFIEQFPEPVRKIAAMYGILPYSVTLPADWPATIKKLSQLPHGTAVSCSRIRQF